MERKKLIKRCQSGDKFISKIQEMDGTDGLHQFEFDWSDESIQNIIKQLEGFKPTVYLDSKGYHTAGYGHRLTPSEKRKYKLNSRVPDEVLQSWFKQDYGDAANEIAKYYPDAEDNVRAALISTQFHGGSKLIRADRDAQGNRTLKGGSQNFEDALNKYIQGDGDYYDNLKSVLHEMQYVDDKDDDGLRSRYGITRGLISGTITPDDFQNTDSLRTVYKGFMSEK